MFGAFLANRSVISIGGDDAVEFLQGLVSNDVRKIADGTSVYAALLSPQGKFLHDFFIVRWQDKIFIDVKRHRVSDLLSRLRIYRLRSKIEIAAEESLSVFALWPESFSELSGLSEVQNNDYIICKDPRLPELGFRVIGNKNSLAEFCRHKSILCVEEEKYDVFRLSLAVPDTDDMIVEKSLLLEFGFEQLSGVDFTKGCYVGQEVTARSKFRGQVRKSLYSVKSDTVLPPSGTQITAGGEIAGEMRASLGKAGIALIYNDKYEDAKAKNISFLSNSINIEIVLPDWAKKS